MPMSQFDNQVTPLANYSTTPTGVALGQVPQDELLGNRLNTLLSGNNPLVRRAGANANAYAGARGSGLDSSLYSAAAENAVLDQMAPIAQTETEQLADIRNRNLEALNQQNIERMGNQTSVQVAGIGARAQHDALMEQARQFDISQQNRAQDREWQLADQRASARANQRSQTFNTLLQSVFSDPSIWRDSQGAMGFFNTYMSNIDSFLTNLFPEYQEPATAGGTP
jgi:hypothetical protein